MSSTRPPARPFFFWVVVLELVGLALFGVLLGLGEESRLSLLALYAPRQPLVVAVMGGVLASVLSRRRVRLLLALHVVVLLVVLFPVMGLRVGTARAAVAPVRLASYNVYFGKLGRPALLDEIAAMPVDIILLQATYSSMAERVKERFPGRSIHEYDDFLLITRYPIVAVEEAPPLSDGTPPKFIGYVLQTEAGALRVYNVHPFSPRHALFDDDDTESNIRHREQQVAALSAAFRRVPTPFVIAGDTNLPGLSAIRRQYLADLHDAFDEVGSGFGYTFPAKRPWMRIDRALATDSIRFVDAHVGPLGASDHRPLFVSFEIVR